MSFAVDTLLPELWVTRTVARGLLNVSYWTLARYVAERWIDGADAERGIRFVRLEDVMRVRAWLDQVGAGRRGPARAQVILAMYALLSGEPMKLALLQRDLNGSTFGFVGRKLTDRSLRWLIKHKFVAKRGRSRATVYYRVGRYDRERERLEGLLGGA